MSKSVRVGKRWFRCRWLWYVERKYGSRWLPASRPYISEGEARGLLAAF